MTKKFRIQIRAYDYTTDFQVSAEDKKEAIEQADLNFEIVDDSPPSDKKATDDDTDDELSGYSKKVRKRLDKATFKRREAERLADEAVKAAQQLNQQNFHFVKQY